MVSKNRLPVEERLKSKVLIARLFDKGKSKRSGALRLRWLETEEASEIQILVVVPKKSFPKAVARNAIKRHIREAYRTQKEKLEPIKKRLESKGLVLGLIYTEREHLSYRIISENLSLLLEHLVSEYG